MSIAASLLFGSFSSAQAQTCTPSGGTEQVLVELNHPMRYRANDPNNSTTTSVLVELSSMRYLTPANAGIHERGLTPDVQVRQPDVEFGAPPPTKDETLDTAIARLTEKKAA